MRGPWWLVAVGGPCAVPGFPQALCRQLDLYARVERHYRGAAADRAVVYLHASPAEMGLLGAVALLPYLVLSLPAGVWVDRMMTYQRLLVLADLAQAMPWWAPQRRVAP